MTENRAPLLVVDDNEMNRDLLARRLNKEGHEVVQAEDGMKAMKLMEEQNFDLILLDVMMPGMTGYEVLEAVKKDERLRDIPVLMISALTEMDSVVRCIELGAEDYLPKPFKTVLLHARVNACLEKKRWRDREAEYLRQLTQEKQRTEELLKVILPEPCIQELKETNTVVPRRFENVVVLFCDIVGFTTYCDSHPAEDVVCHLQNLVESYEDLCMKRGIQKIKTIGDAFMACANLLKPVDDAVKEAVRCGQEMVQAAQTLPCDWQVRVGVHTGPVMGGIVGYRQYLYDVWGDTVNTAARIQHEADPSSVAVSRDCWDLLDGCAQGRSKTVEMRGKGQQEVFILDGLADPELATS